jgi:hypothetical protein
MQRDGRGQFARGVCVIGFRQFGFHNKLKRFRLFRLIVVFEKYSLVFILSIGAAATHINPQNAATPFNTFLEWQIVVFDRRFRRVFFFDYFTS